MHRRLRLTLFALILVAALVIGLPMAFGAAMLGSLTHPGCTRTPVPESAHLQSIRFTTPRGYTLSGFFLGGSSGATVIVVPTMGNDRGAGLPAAQIINDAGFNVLTFDAATCNGASIHSLGYSEADDVAAAMEYLRQRADLDMTRVTLHGFSSAGATSLFAAARHPEIRGVSVEGNYANFADQLGLGQPDGPMEQLIRLGAALSYRVTNGFGVEQLDALSAVDAIAPRPILFIYGDREVSLAGARAMLARAQARGSAAELWIVPGASHGGYLAAAGDAYAHKLAAFHRQVDAES